MGARRKPGTTLREIAEQAGCSITAVSKVLNGAKGSAGVSPRTRARVRAIARELGYSPNYHARSLRAGGTDTLGLVCSFHEGDHHHNAFWGQLIQGVQQRTRAAGNDLLIIGPAGGVNEIERARKHLLERRIDALIVPTPMYRDELGVLADLDALVVYAMAPGPGAHPVVGIDLAPGTAEAMRYLAQLGHEDMLWVPMTLGGRVTDPPRDACVRSAAQVAGLHLVTSPISAEAIGGLEAVGPYIEQSRQQFAAFLRDGRIPSAVVAYTERSAMGICAALADAGVRVPYDVSVVAFDDIYAHLATPPLTVVSIRLRSVGERAAEVAMERGGGAGPSATGLVPVESIPSELVIRSSTAEATRSPRHAGHITKGTTR